MRTAARPVTPDAPLWLLALATVLGTTSNHLFVPALPAAAQDLGVGAHAMQLTISVYLVGLAVGQLAYGPLSDAYGRRRLQLIGLAMFVMGSAAAACAPDLRTLLTARVVQALGGCAGIALGRAMVRDTTQGDRTVRRLAILGLMVLVWPGLGPMLGGAFAAAFGWRPLFVLLAAAGTLTFIIAWFRLPETRPGSGVFTLRKMASDYRALFGCVPLVAYALGGGAITTSVYAFLAAAPFVLGERLHQPVEMVGVWSGVVMMGIIVGTGFATVLVRRLGAARVLVIGMAMIVASSSLQLALVLLDALTVGMLVGAMLTFTTGIGLVHPVLLARTLDLRPAMAGSAAGFYGFSQMALGALCATLVGVGSDPTVSCAVVLCGATAASCLGVAFGTRRQRQQKGERDAAPRPG